jgi:splicing factor 3B subunit 2
MCVCVCVCLCLCVCLCIFLYFCTLTLPAILLPFALISFFKAKFGDLYFEGKEMEVDLNRKKTGVLSVRVREALGMTSEHSPPPWLLNMQRYGPPPSYPSMKIPGLNAPLPTIQCQYGFHPDGWGKPPIDMYGRALYGGNPFDPPGSGGRSGDDDFPIDGLVTSDGKTINKDSWGALPTGMLEEGQASEEEEAEESSNDEMEDSEEEETAEDGEERPGDGLDSVLPPPANLQSYTAPVDLRKQAGDETPFAEPPKQLYQVMEQRSAKPQAGAVFASDVTYVVPGTASAAAGGPAVLATKTPEGAESVLSKAMPAGETAKRKRKAEDDEEDELGKNFKF